MQVGLRDVVAGCGAVAGCVRRRRPACPAIDPGNHRCSRHLPLSSRLIFGVAGAEGVKKRRTAGERAVNVGAGLTRSLNRMATGLDRFPGKFRSCAGEARARRRGRPRSLRGQLAVEVSLSPLAIRIARRDRPLIQGLTLFAQEWSGGDRLIHITEGVIVEEDRGEPERLAEAELRRGEGSEVELAGELARRRVVRAAGVDPRRRARDDRARRPAGGGRLRLIASWPGALGRAADRARGQARGGLRPARKAGAPGRRPPLHGPGLPPGHAGDRGHPAGRLRPRAVAALERGWALWAETWGAGLELDLSERVRSRSGPRPGRFACTC